MEKITIKNRLTGEIEREFPAEDYVVARTSSKIRKRAFDMLSDSQFDSLISAALSGTRKGKRLEGARLVMTKHISCTDAAEFAGVSPASVTQLVLQLEGHIRKARRIQLEQKMGKPFVPDPNYVMPDSSFLQDRKNPLLNVSPPPQKKVRIPHHEFMRLLALAKPTWKMRGSEEGARLRLVQGASMGEVRESYPDISVEATRNLVDEIKAIKQAEDDQLASEFE